MQGVSVVAFIWQSQATYLLGSGHAWDQDMLGITRFMDHIRYKSINSTLIIGNYMRTNIPVYNVPELSDT